MTTILIDHPSRELPFAVELSKRLSKKFNCFIDDQDGYFTPTGSNFLNRIKFDSDIIISPSYNSNRTKYIKIRSILSRTPLVLYHSEQAIIPIAFNEKMDANSSSFTDDIALHLVWGKSFAYALVARGVNPERIYIVGNYRFDNLNLNSHRESNSITNILIPTSFSGADLTDSEWALMCKEYSYDYKLKSPEKFRYARENVIELANELDKKGYKITLRSHPGESVSYYKNRLNKSINLSDGNSSSFDEDLCKADLVIVSNHSTSIYDLLNRGKKFISADFGCSCHSYPKFAYPSINYKDIYMTENFNDMIFQSIKSAENSFDWFFSKTNRPTIERIASVLEGVNINKLNIPKIKFNDLISLGVIFIKFAYCNISSMLKINILLSPIEKSYTKWIEAGHSIHNYMDIKSRNIELHYKSKNYKDESNNLKLQKCELSGAWIQE